jgi:hypothetical protein
VNSKLTATHTFPTKNQMYKLFAAYSTRSIINKCKPVIAINGLDLHTGQSNKLSTKDIAKALHKSCHNEVTTWYDQIGDAHLTPTAVQQSPVFSSAHHSTTANHRHGLDFTSVLGLTATNPIIDYNDVTISVVMSYSEISQGATLFNFTNSGGNRFSAHTPWSDGTIYFDSSDLNGSDWRVSGASKIKPYQTHVLTFVRSATERIILVNGAELARESNSTPSTSLKGSFVLGANNSVSSGFAGTIYEVIIGDTAAAKSVVSKQKKVFGIC